MSGPRGARRRARQPTAPYLDALVAYGFRGPTRFHVPGHKGGSGADPGLRWALGERALLLDVPQDTEGIDIGPEPTPYAQAEELAAAAYGAERSWFLTNGATQGNHALCLALAPPGDARRAAAQRAREPDRRARPLAAGCRRSSRRRPTTSWGWRTASRRRRCGRRWSAATDARAVFVVSPTYYGMVRRRGGARRGRARGRRGARRRPGVGAALRLPPGRAAVGARARRRRRHHLDAQDRRRAHAGGDAARRGAGGSASTRPPSRARCGSCARRAPARCCSPRSTPRAARWRSTGRRCSRGTLAAAAHARAAIDAVPGCAVVGRAARRAARACTAGTRCGS